MTPLQLERRIRHLPEAIKNTERKLAALYREAEEYRMRDILDQPAEIDGAWEREIAIARLHAAAHRQAHYEADRDAA